MRWQYRITAQYTIPAVMGDTSPAVTNAIASSKPPSPASPDRRTTRVAVGTYGTRLPGRTGASTGPRSSGDRTRSYAASQAGVHTPGIPRPPTGVSVIWLVGGPTSSGIARAMALRTASTSISTLELLGSQGSAREGESLAQALG